MYVCFHDFIYRTENKQVKEQLMKKKRDMISCQLILIFYVLLFILKFNNAYKTCFKQSNHINYLFLNDMSQIKIPLIPFDCLYCQSAYQVNQ